ncbi:MAG: carbohydrate kinase [Lachnospiraceae bacterium]|nr:carbohydrate kinase [Lachnospiraceae bacterium]
MSGSYYIGLDNGGSATKCVIFDPAGRQISGASERVPVRRTGEGFTERDPEQLWAANCAVIRKALALSGLAPEEIRALSLCGYGGGLVMTGEDGNCVYPLIVSTDTRADSLLTAFQEDGTDEKVYRRTLQHLWSGQHGVLLPWFKRNMPSVLGQAAHILSIKDYIRFRLTGRYATEPTDATNTNLFHPEKKIFDPEIFRALSIEECLQKMPSAVLRSCECAGRLTAEAAALTGLPEGLPVAAGLYDAAACTLGSGILDDSLAAIVLGTWTISGHLTRTLAECEGQNNSMCGFLDGWYFSEESSPSSAGNLDWFVEQYYAKLCPEGADVYETCNERVSALDPASSDLVFLPYLYGSNSIPEARGALLNLAGHHTADQVLMAIYEGIVFSLQQHMELLYPGGFPSAARFSGGVSRSSVWCQLLADVLGITIETTECRELGALGSAVCAAIADGRYTDYAQAAAHMTHVSGRFYPNREKHAVYQKKYAVYQKAIEALAVFYH